MKMDSLLWLTAMSLHLVQSPAGLLVELRLENMSSSECKKVVSDIFGKIEFLMEYEKIGLYAHFALFSKFLALLFSKILRKMCSKNATYDHIALIFDKCV